MMMAPIDRKLPFPGPFPGPIPQPFPKPLPTLPIVDPADRAAFVVLDANGDGKLGKDEWKSANYADDRFAAFDANHDGNVSEREFTTGRRFEREFNKKDVNGDGQLSRFELQGLMYKHFDAIGKTMLQAAEAGQGLADKVMRCIPPSIADRFFRFDSNHDGAVSSTEYVTGRTNESRLQAPPSLPHWPELPTQPHWPHKLGQLEA